MASIDNCKTQCHEVDVSDKFFLKLQRQISITIGGNGILISMTPKEATQLAFKLIKKAKQNNGTSNRY